MTNLLRAEPTSVRTVTDERDLPGEGFSTYYIRSASDPRYMIAGKSGVVYVREDGAPWGEDGWKVTADELGNVIDREVAHNKIDRNQV